MNNKKNINFLVKSTNLNNSCNKNKNKIFGLINKFNTIKIYPKDKNQCHRKSKDIRFVSNQDLKGVK